LKSPASAGYEAAIMLPLAWLVAVAAAASAASPALPAVDSYERWVQPPQRSDAERQVAAMVKAWARRHDLRLVDDARLSWAARAALPELPLEPSAPLSVETSRLRAQRLGWTDGELAAVAVHAPAGGDIGAALVSRLEADIARLHVNRVGLAALRTDEGTVALVLLSRRLVRLWPLPAWVPKGAVVHLRGTSMVAGSLTLAVAMPGGQVQKTPLSSAGRRFERDIAMGDAPGAVQVQILVDRGVGPEVAAQWPVAVEVEPPEVTALAPAMHGETALVDSEVAGRLAALILGARAAAGLALPATSNALNEVAQAHAEDMRDHRFFAHISPQRGDLPARLASRGVRFSRALENLAVAAGVDDVLRQWLESPSHRANLLDPDIDTFGIGVGVEHDPTGGNDRLYAVLVLARLADDGTPLELAARVLARLNAERARLGLAPLDADPELSRLAMQHAAAGARAGPSAGLEMARRKLVEDAFHELDVGAAAADVFVTSSIAVVTRSQHVRGAFERAGVGVFRPEGGDGRLWVTVLYAAN
jgi:uncharacterized protein YkwD